MLNFSDKNIKEGDLFQTCKDLLSHSKKNEQIQIFKSIEKEIKPLLSTILSDKIIKTHPFLSEELYLYLCKKIFTETTKEKVQQKILEDPQLNLSILRNEVRKIKSKKIVVFCQSKSGSSFASNIIADACKFVKVNLSTTALSPSYQGIGVNGRGHEICEYSLLKAIYDTKKNSGFVSQRHTKSSLYLINQINHFDLTPIILTRNIFDSLVSAHDHLYDYHVNSLKNNTEPFLVEGFQEIPKNFTSLDLDTRLKIICSICGPWYIKFYISWKRYAEKIEKEYLWITYENHILNQEKFINKISEFLKLENSEINNLSCFFKKPNRFKSRFNYGVVGRGKKIPNISKDYLINFAKNYDHEISTEDYYKMFGI